MVMASLPGPSFDGSYFSLFLSCMAFVSTNSFDCTLSLSFSAYLDGPVSASTLLWRSNCSLSLFWTAAYCFITISSSRLLILSIWSLAVCTSLTLFFSMLSSIFSVYFSISFRNRYSSTCSFCSRRRPSFWRWRERRMRSCSSFCCMSSAYRYTVFSFFHFSSSSFLFERSAADTALALRPCAGGRPSPMMSCKSLFNLLKRLFWLSTLDADFIESDCFLTSLYCFIRPFFFSSSSCTF